MYRSRREVFVSAHSIRLHGPWYFLEIREPDEAVLRHATTEAPIASMNRFRFEDAASTLATSFDDSTSLLLIRPFRQPTGLTPSCGLLVTVQSLQKIGVVWLNGQRLTASATDDSTYAVDSPLLMQNRLGVLLNVVSPDAPLLSSASLIIKDES